MLLINVFLEEVLSIIHYRKPIFLSVIVLLGMILIMNINIAEATTCQKNRCWIQSSVTVIASIDSSGKYGFARGAAHSDGPDSVEAYFEFTANRIIFYVKFVTIAAGESFDTGYIEKPSGIHDIVTAYGETTLTSSQMRDAS
ncbi:MAG: hypothetical protein B6U89_00510 [Desulfurococcales archaeon ex4484_58]|nr:MAG: hypothetical protein B6U89_00510 [Desulfurococcales archaeon ex4484_58]